MIAMIDNYDSFTYNLVQYLRELGMPVEVFRNDKISVQDIGEINPVGIVISPGPGRPEQAGISLSLLKEFSGRVPILGVCLGHQCIAHVFGGQVEPAPRLMHGKTSTIYHTGQGIFANLPRSFTATRYHSLIVNEPLPDVLKLTAFTIDGEVMGIRHREYPTFGVQFHPESILTAEGKRLLENFLTYENGTKESDNGH